jgi:predicted GNAT family acetyltransferase/co-chaperonin GroES (HSP10)
MSFDYEGAIKEGYTDSDIATHLAGKSGFDLPGALKEGYSYGDIAAHLSGGNGKKAIPATPLLDKLKISLPDDTSGIFMPEPGPEKLNTTGAFSTPLLSRLPGDPSIPKSPIEIIREPFTGESLERKAFKPGLDPEANQIKMPSPFTAGGAGKVLGTAALGIPSSIVGGITGLGVGSAAQVDQLLGKDVDPWIEANRALEATAMRGNMVSTPTEEEALQQLMYAMKPFEMAGAGLGGLAELLSTGDHQKATDVIEGRSSGSNVAVPIAKVIGETSAVFGAGGVKAPVESLLNKLAMTTPVRRLTIPERGVTEPLTLEQLRGTGISDGELARLFPEEFKRALKTRATGEGQAPKEGPSSPWTPPVGLSRTAGPADMARAKVSPASPLERLLIDLKEAKTRGQANVAQPPAVIRQGLERPLLPAPKIPTDVADFQPTEESAIVESVQAKITELKNQIDAWGRWETNSALVSELKQRTGLQEKAQAESLSVDEGKGPYKGAETTPKAVGGMTREEFISRAESLHDEKDFTKAWLRDNEDIPRDLKPNETRSVSKPNNATLIVSADKNGKAVGVASVVRDGKGNAYIEHIAVSPKARRQGIATSLIGEAKKQFGEVGFVGPYTPDAAGVVYDNLVKKSIPNPSQPPIEGKGVTVGKQPWEMTREELTVERGKLKGETSESIQEKIDNKLDEGIAEDSPEIVDLYRKRDIIDNKDLHDARSDIAARIKEVAPNADIDYILNDIYSLKTGGQGSVYMAAKYTQDAVSNVKKTGEKIIRHLTEEYGRKHNLDMDGYLNPNMSGLTPKGIETFKRGIVEEAKKITDAVTSYFERKTETGKPPIEGKGVTVGKITESDYIAALKNKESFELSEQQRKQGIIVPGKRPPTPEELKIIEIGDKIYEKATTKAVMEADGIYLMKMEGKGKKAKEVGKTLDELRNEYDIFKGKTEAEMQGIVKGYREKADKLIESLFSKTKPPIEGKGATSALPMAEGAAQGPLEKAVAAKEPWEMMPDEYIGNTTGDTRAIRQSAHPQHVKRAISEGKDVPLEVLKKYDKNHWAQIAIEKDYPELKITPKGEFKTADLEGMSERDTFGLVNPETEIGTLKPKKDLSPTGGMFEKEAIQDFGEKIGGARKDTAESGYTMTGKAKADDFTKTLKTKQTDKGTMLYSGIDPTQTLKVLRGLKGNIKEAMPHLERLGQRIYDSGKTNAKDWLGGMKKALGDLWESFKTAMRKVWDKVSKPLRNEKGAVGEKSPYDATKEELKKAADHPAKSADETLKNMKLRGSDPVKEFDQIMRDNRLIVDDYKGNGKVPLRQVTGIPVSMPKIPEKDIRIWMKGLSPSTIYREVFGLQDNPSVEVMMANMTNFQNRRNAVMFAKDALKGIPNDSKTILKAVKPLFKENLPLLNEFAKLQDQKTTLTNRLSKIPRHTEYESLKKQVGKMETGLSKIQERVRWFNSEGAEIAFQTAKKKRMDAFKKQVNELRQKETVKGPSIMPGEVSAEKAKTYRMEGYRAAWEKMKQMQFDAYKSKWEGVERKTEKMIRLRRAKMAQIEETFKRVPDYMEIKAKLKGLNAQQKALYPAFEKMGLKHDKLMAELAKTSSDVRVFLAANETLPDTIKLTEAEIRSSEMIKDYMKKTRDDLENLGVPVIKTKAYMTHLVRDLIEDSDVSRAMPRFVTKWGRPPTLLRFMSRLPHSRAWFPSANAVVEAYIPMAEFKIAYQPFLDRWTPFIDSLQKPELRDYMTKWVTQNLYRPKAGIAEKVVNAAVAFEYVRLIGGSLSVGFKHLFKQLGSFQVYGMAAGLKGEAKTIQAAVQFFKGKIGIKGRDSEKRVYRAYVNMLSMVRAMDEVPTMRDAQKWLKLTTGQPTVMVEALDNGVSVFAGIISGAKKGIPVETIRRQLWDTVLLANFRGGWDQPLWQKGSILRAASMFQMTPMKLTEKLGTQIAGALRNKKDNFGTHYGTQLLRLLIAVGIAEVIARQNDTSIADISLFHTPFARHYIVPTENAPYFRFEMPRTTTAPVLAWIQEMSKEGLWEGTAKHLTDWGIITKLQKAESGKYSKRYEDPLKYMLGLQKIESDREHFKKVMKKERAERAKERKERRGNR